MFAAVSVHVRLGDQELCNSVTKLAGEAVTILISDFKRPFCRNSSEDNLTRPTRKTSLRVSTTSIANERTYAFFHCRGIEGKDTP